MTEIKLSYSLSRAGETVAVGSLVTMDLSFPSRIFESLIDRYQADYIRVRDSQGQIWEKWVERE